VVPIAHTTYFYVIIIQYQNIAVTIYCTIINNNERGIYVAHSQQHTRIILMQKKLQPYIVAHASVNPVYRNGLWYCQNHHTDTKPKNNHIDLDEITDDFNKYDKLERHE